jgi:hypothetical protein
MCGHQQPASPARKLRQVDGELQELHRESVRQRIAERATSRKQQGRARTLPELLALAKERGYSPGWAYRVAAARQVR